MRIDNVEIINFRQYKNIEFDFKKNNSSDLHIIIGNNGIGKTNLLNAISWCLYGTEPHLGNEKIARKRINASELENAISLGRKTCQTKVTVTISVDNKLILFERSQEFKATKDPFEFKPVFVVTIIAEQGNKVLTDIEEISNIRKQYLPEEISEYFFFDGEQLDKYFISDQGEKIHEAIYNISQVNLLSSMSERLGNVIREFQDQAGKKNVGINELNAKKNDAEATVTTIVDSISNCKKQIGIAESEITICNEFLVGKEGVPEKEKEYQNLAKEIEEKKLELEKCSTKFKQFLREYKILFSLYPKLKKTLELINRKESQGELPPNIDKQFLERMLKDHKCFICDRPMEDEEESKVEHLLNQLKLSSSVSHLLVKIKSPLEESIERCKAYPKIREELIHREKEIQESLDSLNDRFNKLDVYLRNYQDKEKIKDMYEKRSKYDEIRKKNEYNKAKFELQLEGSKKNLEIIEDELAKAIENQEELKVLKKQIAFATESKSIVEEIETEMMQEVREKMTKETMEIFKMLDWKTETFSHIVLDDSYVLELFDTYGYPMVGACSAAERALLALSFTLALQKVSGYDSMLFIDTPVGRVDLENRANFATVLSQIAENKQVIMMFTPSEYSQEIKNVLEPCASTFKELKTIDESETFIG